MPGVTRLKKGVNVEHAHLMTFIAEKLGNQLPAIRRVRFTGSYGPADALGFGDVGGGGACGQSFGDARQAALRIGSRKARDRVYFGCASAGLCVGGPDYLTASTTDCAQTLMF